MNGFASKPLEPAHLLTEIARVLALPSSAQAATTATTATTTATIDWSRGLELWGSPERLQGALERFVRDHQPSCALLQRDLAHSDWTALAQRAHRMRGAAGNLTLRQVHSLAERAENAANAHDAASASAAIAALPAALEAVRSALDTQDSAGTTTSTTTTAALAPLSPQQQQDALAALAQLCAALAQGEWPEAPLQALQDTLPAPALQQLQQAIERFDFSQAQRALADLQAQLLLHT